ncbi:hypothetical protein L207DRAFT_170137 [Hyaloscypha variabilis F]|uniref:Uncharacterized protein n=1 Tax=Hyaloscypha variabilis (strain UAMH 11265 / GT02V1 / F) TaxID=1149755 RepID=A0A2J6R4D0_HYAVF|nr:hypothetical protein L207DRAFT_170137 [Hyaloscypha variabilis F]
MEAIMQREILCSSTSSSLCQIRPRSLSDANRFRLHRYQPFPNHQSPHSTTRAAGISSCLRQGSRRPCAIQCLPMAPLHRRSRRARSHPIRIVTPQCVSLKHFLRSKLLRQGGRRSNPNLYRVRTHRKGLQRSLGSNHLHIHKYNLRVTSQCPPTIHHYTPCLAQQQTFPKPHAKNVIDLLTSPETYDDISNRESTDTVAPSMGAFGPSVRLGIETGTFLPMVMVILMDPQYHFIAIQLDASIIKIIHPGNRFLEKTAGTDIPEKPMVVDHKDCAASQQRPCDLEWTEWVYLLPRLATKRQVPARPPHDGQIGQILAFLKGHAPKFAFSPLPNPARPGFIDEPPRQRPPRKRPRGKRYVYIWQCCACGQASIGIMVESCPDCGGSRSPYLALGGMAMPNTWAPNAWNIRVESLYSISALFHPIRKDQHPMSYQGQYQFSPLDMAFIKARGVEFTNKNMERFDTPAKEFLSLLDNQFGRVTGKFMDQGYQIDVANCVALLDFGSRVNVLMPATQDDCCPIKADIAAKLSHSMVSFRNAQSMSNATLRTVLQRIGDPNVLPFLHVTLTFTFYKAQHQRSMQLLETEFPWDLLSNMLNTLLASYAPFSRIEDDQLSRPEKEDALAFPEDFTVRGLLFNEDYFPENWFASGNLEIDADDWPEPLSKMNHPLSKMNHPLFKMNHPLAKMNHPLDSMGSLLSLATRRFTTRNSLLFYRTRFLFPP